MTSVPDIREPDIGEPAARRPALDVEGGQVGDATDGTPDETPSFEQYVTARGAALLRFATLLTGDAHRAEDLVQEALAKACLRWDRISRINDPDMYLRRMLVNGSRSWWRRRTNRELPVEGTTDWATAEDFASASAQRDEMWRLIDALPHRQRAVVVLRYYEDLDDATIAEILNCSPGTVRTHAMRALNGLRRRYGVAGSMSSGPRSAR